MAFENIVAFREGYGLTLASWADGKFVSKKDTFTLQGNNGGWVTIPSDEYVRHNATGVIAMRDYDDDGNAVDWSDYTAYRATYSLITRATKAKTTYTNETQSVDYLGYQFDIVDEFTGEVDVAADNNLVVQEVYATGGHIGYFSIGDTDEYSIEADNGNFRLRSNVPSFELGDATAFGTGIGIWQGNDSGTYKWRVGDPAGDYAQWDGADFSITGDIIADGGSIGGFDIGSDYLRDAANSFGLASTVTVSDDVRFWAGAAFASRATAPARIYESGKGVFSDVQVTGGIQTAVFQKNLVSAFAGSMIVAKSASTIHNAATATGTTFTLDVKKQDGGAPFANGDIVRITDGTNTTWATVDTGTDQTDYWRYTATWQNGSSSATYSAGLTVVDYGASGQGYFGVSADGTFGAGTLWTINTHAGAPWSTSTQQVYANSSGQLVAGSGNVVLDANGMSIVAGPSLYNGITWVRSGTSTKVADILAVNQFAVANRLVLSAYATAGNVDVAQARLFAYNTASTQIGNFNLTAVAASAYATLTASTGTFAGFTIGSSSSPNATLDLRGSAIFNEDGGDYDFRIEGDTNANLFFVDASTDRIGVGTNTPSVTFDVVGAGKFSGALTTTGAFTSIGIDDNADAVAMTIDSNERLIIGHTSTLNAGSAGTNAKFQIHSNTAPAGVAGFACVRFTNDTGGAVLLFGKSRDTVVGGHTVVQNGDTLGGIDFVGDDSAGYITGARISAAVDNTPGTNDMPTKLTFGTTADGANAPTTRLTIDSAGDFTFADGSDFILGSTNGTKIGMATTQKLGFYNATPIVQPGATTDLGTVLSNLGLRAAGTAYPITTSGAVLINGANGFGYGSGAGGTVTQATNKSTGVTLNKVCGQITTHNAALAANTTVSFTLTNSAIAAGDVLVLNHISGGTAGAYLINAQSAAGSASINVRNITTGSLSEAIVIAFAVLKAVTA